jgi:hypothetical protein
MLSRRTALFGLLAAPAIIRTPGLLMPVRRTPELAGPGHYTVTLYGDEWFLVHQGGRDVKVRMGDLLSFVAA